MSKEISQHARRCHAECMLTINGYAYHVCQLLTPPMVVFGDPHGAILPAHAA